MSGNTDMKLRSGISNEEQRFFYKPITRLIGLLILVTLAEI